MTDLILLAALLQGPKHGYQLKHEAGIILGHGVLHNNLVYPLLKRFVSKKWVVRKAAPGQRGQTRQQYSLTALGRKELFARLSHFTEQEASSLDAFVVRVGLFRLLPSETRSRILDARMNFLRRAMETLEAVQTNFPLDRYAAEVTSHLRAGIQSELDWTERLQKFEKSRKNDPHD